MGLAVVCILFLQGIYPENKVGEHSDSYMKISVCKTKLAAGSVAGSCCSPQKGQNPRECSILAGEEGNNAFDDVIAMLQKKITQ